MSQYDQYILYEGCQHTGDNVDILHIECTGHIVFIVNIECTGDNLYILPI